MKLENLREITLNIEGNIYDQRAHDIANILAYDKEHYEDVNVITVLKACEIAGILKIKENK
jgi:hypothetical protein